MADMTDAELDEIDRELKLWSRPEIKDDPATRALTALRETRAKLREVEANLDWLLALDPLALGELYWSTNGLVSRETLRARRAAEKEPKA